MPVIPAMWETDIRGLVPGKNVRSYLKNKIKSKRAKGIAYA
jgi:hypothetical protein